MGQTSKQPTRNPSVIYYPPPDKVVDRLVHDASQRLADQTGDQRYLDPEIMWGLAAFIKLVGKIKAKQLNQAEQNGSAFDTLNEQSYLIEK